MAEQKIVQMIATEPLFIGRARAANPGDVVSSANVEKYGWGDRVRKDDELVKDPDELVKDPDELVKDPDEPVTAPPKAPKAPKTPGP